MLPSRGVAEPSPRPSPHISQGRVDVVVGVPISGDEEGQAAVGRQDVHAAVLVSVPGQQGDAALLHVQRRRDRVQRLQGAAEERGPRQCFLGLLTAPGWKLGRVTNPTNRWRNRGPERGGESKEPGSLSPAHAVPGQGSGDWNLPPGHTFILKQATVSLSLIFPQL